MPKNQPKPTVKKDQPGEMRKFRIHVTHQGAEISTALMEVSQQVIDRCSAKEWQETYYPVENAEEVAANIARNMVANKRTLSQLDGFADLDDSLVKFHGSPDPEREFEVVAEEI